MKIDISELKDKILTLNPQRNYLRVVFYYKNLNGFGVYSNELLKFSGVATIYNGEIIFKKTWSSGLYVSLNQIEIHNLKIVKFNSSDLKRCWNASNEFLN